MEYKGPNGIHPARNNDAVPSIPRGNKNAARKVAAETFGKFQCLETAVRDTGNALFVALGVG